jgi:hypothetical protein
MSAKQMVGAAQDISVCDNFLTENEYKGIYDIFTGATIPWFFNGSVTYGSGPIDSKLRDFQFTHTMYMSGRVQSPIFDALAPILDKLNTKAIIRVKANLIPLAEQIIEHDMHMDFPYDAKTAIFYVNSNNGYTKFETGQKVQSVGNRAVVFPMQIKHCGTTCTDSKIRVVINVNYF